MNTMLLPMLLYLVVGLGASQGSGAVPPELDDTLRLAGLVGLAGALALLYELAVRRQEMDKTKQGSTLVRAGNRRPLRLARSSLDPDRPPPARAGWQRTLHAVSLAALTPLLEKNVVKTLSLDVPVIFSMSRVIVLAFAVGMLRRIWQSGVAGWPEATLAITVVLALPILGALERAAPEHVVELTKALVGRFGTGDVRGVGDVHRTDAREPSRHDDHRSD